MSGSKTLLSISCCDQNGQPSGEGQFQAMINPANATSIPTTNRFMCFPNVRSLGGRRGSQGGPGVAFDLLGQ